MIFDRFRFALVFASASVFGCSSDSPGDGGTNTNWAKCDDAGACPSGYECVARQCLPVSDAGGGQSTDARSGSSTDGASVSQATAGYSIQVRVGFAYDDQTRNPTIAWLGEAPTAAVGALPLSRTFESQEAAHAFEGTFVVFLGGTEVARGTASFAVCDAVSDLGVDPRGIRTVFVRRSYAAGALYLDTHSNSDAPHGCSLEPVEPLILDRTHRVLFRLPSSEPLTFSALGRDVFPRALQLFPQRPVWEVGVTAENGQKGTFGTLNVSSSGQPLGTVPLSFEECDRTTSKGVVAEERWLTIGSDAGTSTVGVDPYGSLLCTFDDGTASSSVP